MQITEASLVVTNHRAKGIDRLAWEWLCELQDLRRFRADQMVVAEGAKCLQRLDWIRRFIQQRSCPCKRACDVWRGKSLCHDKGIAKSDLNARIKLLPCSR